MTGIASVLVMASVLAGGAPAVTAQVTARDACTVLTLAELSAAAGVTVQRPRPTSAPDGSTCRFRAGTETLTLAIAPGTRADFDAFRKVLVDEGKAVEPIAGLGATGYFWDNRIYALAGTYSFSVQVGEFAPVNPARRQQARAVAAAVAARLQ